MPRTIKKPTLRKYLDDAVNVRPSSAHRQAAFEFGEGYLGEGSTVDDLPTFYTVGQLFAWVLSIKASRGNMDAFKEFGDRLAAKPRAPQVAVNNFAASPGAAQAAASKNPAEADAAQDYYAQLGGAGAEDDEEGDDPREVAEFLN